MIFFVVIFCLYYHLADCEVENAHLIVDPNNEI